MGLWIKQFVPRVSLWDLYHPCPVLVVLEVVLLGGTRTLGTQVEPRESTPDVSSTNRELSTSFTRPCEPGLRHQKGVRLHLELHRSLPCRTAGPSHLPLKLDP